MPTPIETIDVGTQAIGGTDGDKNYQGSAKINVLLAPLVGATGALIVSEGVPSVAVPEASAGAISLKQMVIRDIQRGSSLPVQPALQLASPNSGYVAGNTPILLIGTGLLTTTSVMFGSAPALSFYALSDTQIWCLSRSTTLVGLTTITVTTANRVGAAGLSATTPFTFKNAGLAGTATMFLVSSDNAAFGSYESMCLGNDLQLWSASHRAIAETPLTQRIVQVLLPGETIGVVSTVSNNQAGGSTLHLTGPVAGPDGNIWATTHDGYVHKVPTNGDSATKKKLPYANLEGAFGLPNNYPYNMCVSPDGSIWISGHSDSSGNWYVWRVTVDLEITPFIYSSQPILKQIFAGLDGNVWAVDVLTTGSTLGFYKISPSGSLSLVGFFQFAPSGSFIDQAAIGPDSNVYVCGSNFGTTPATGYVTRFNPNDLSSAVSLVLPTNDDVDDMCFGPDGNLWISTASFTTNFSIFKVSTGLANLQSVVVAGSFADGNLCGFGIASGPDGFIYVAMTSLDGTFTGYVKVA